MTTPDPEPLARPEPAPEPLQAEPEENPIVGWAKAVVFGISDTAKDMLAEGRRGAREAMDQGWDRFDAKTKRRRK